LSKLLSIAALSTPILLTAACGGSGECKTDGYPSAPSGASSTVHVSAGCSAEDADGSASAPYPTISAAIAKAGKGAAVLVVAGKYKENLLIEKDIHIVGVSKEKWGAGATIELSAPEATAIRVTSGAKATLEGFNISAPIGVGVFAKGGTATIVASKIEGAVVDGSGTLGYGVTAADEGAIILQNSAITGSAGLGALVAAATGTFTGSNISDNAAGGIRLDSATGEVTIEDNTLASNTSFGIGVFSSKAIILQNQIKDTQADAKGIGDAVLVTDLPGGATSSVKAQDNTITGAARVGILANAGTSGIILQNNTISGSAAAAAFGAAIWLQKGAGGAVGNEITGNTMTGNRFVGLGLSGETHGIILQHNAMSGTTMGTTFDGPKSVDIGDGMNLFKGASANATENTFGQNARFGMILDSALGSTSIQNNTVVDNSLGGIILQNVGDMPNVTANHDGAAGAVGETVATMPFGLNQSDFAAEF
jgi:parallel beta-helix repeat protein